MALFLWIFAVMLFVSGLGLLIRGQVLWGIAIIVTALLVGPGGVSLFTLADGGPRTARAAAAMQR